MFDLYILKTCPYCKKVIEFMDENNIKYSLKDVANSDKYNELIKIGGKSQVPFLVDNNNNVKLYESDEIIDYLKNKM